MNVPVNYTIYVESGYEEENIGADNYWSYNESARKKISDE